MANDDRKEFAETTTAQAIALGGDRSVFDQSTDLITQLDRYDYSYLWTWMGVPIIQMPADIMATQEVIWKTQPDIIIEVGVARGGSVLMMASMLKLIGKGRVIGVDIDIRPHNRESIESNPVSDRITLIEGGSVDPEILDRVKAEIPDGASVMVVLDSDHSYDHVLKECRAYGPLVTMGQYLIVADTLLGFLSEDQTPKKRSHTWLKGNEPLAAAQQYLSESERFEVDEALNGKLVLSSSPQGYCKCVKP